MMEKGQSEVTNKIRSAIKQKLSEISDFVDDELPEYIMILVANQRSKLQIEKDLSLFLRDDTKRFTDWLWDLLNNLNTVAKNNQTSVSKTDTVVLNKDTEEDEDAVDLGFDLDEHETDFLSHDESNDSFVNKPSVQPSSLQSNEVKKVVTKSIQSCKVLEKNKTETSSSAKSNKKIPSQTSKEPLSSAVVPVKRKFTNSEDEYDPAKPEYKRAMHTSNIRKYGGPAALQANKLLLKAVDEAAKSILAGKKIEDFYKPTPIKVLTSTRYDVPLPRNDSNTLRKRNTYQKVVTQPKVNQTFPEFSMSQRDSVEYPSDVVMEDETELPVSPQKSRTICLKSVPLILNTHEMESNDSIPENNYSYSFRALEETRPKSPHFIVTLDGVSRTSFKKKFEENSLDSLEDEDENDEEDGNELMTNDVDTTPEKKVKLNERCKYWPACRNSDHCPYHHPTVPCKCFPDCKFGDKCLYIHPNCKFDALCSRKDCPFTHASKRKLPLIAVPVKLAPVKSRKMKIICKYYPKCASRNCPFIHPKLCRYGTECRLPACLYGHFPVPPRSQMKWHAAIS